MGRPLRDYRGAGYSDRYLGSMQNRAYTQYAAECLIPRGYMHTNLSSSLIVEAAEA